MLYECPAPRPGEGEDIAGLPLLEVPPIIDWDAFFVLHRSRETALKLMLKPLNKISGSKPGPPAAGTGTASASGTGSASLRLSDSDFTGTGKLDRPASGDSARDSEADSESDSDAVLRLRLAAARRLRVLSGPGASGTGVQMLHHFMISGGASYY
jgi:hypothetical protein